jgi:ribosomal protein S18 acetylase RimI-like enzyme
MTSIAIRRLSAKTPERTKAAIDRLLKASRSSLVREREHLSGVEERIGEADVDPSRLLLYARIDREAVGFVDATLHAPEPRDATIAQIVVKRDRRRSGIASALVLAALPEEIERVVAGVHQDNLEARTFFEELGLEAVERWTDGMLLAGDAATVRARIEPGPDG